MLNEIETQIFARRQRFADMLFNSEADRQRVIDIFRERFRCVPNNADTALVLGTSYKLFPDKFLKRVFTGSELAMRGNVENILFSGESDHLSLDEDQAARSVNLAVDAFGVDPGKILSVGGKNTKENILESVKMLELHPETKSLFLISEARHLIRVFSIAQYEMKKIGVQVYPYPIFGTESLDPNDAGVQLELIKALVYNRVLNKTGDSIQPKMQAKIDSLIKHYEELLGNTPQQVEVPFEEWKCQYVRYLDTK